MKEQRRGQLARWVPRSSLRTNALLIALAMLVLPQAIVVGWSAMERDIGGTLQWSARASAEEVAEVLVQARAAGLGPALVEQRLGEVAERHTARIRVVRADGTMLYDVDHDRGTDLVHQVGTWFFGPDGAPTLRELDDTLGPLPKRPEVQRVTGWLSPGPPLPAPLAEGSAHRYPFGAERTGEPGGPPPVSPLFANPAPVLRSSEVDAGCRTSPAGKLLVCHAARAFIDGPEVKAIYVQESSRRAVRALYDLRYHLMRLSVLMLPLALVFSWWMGIRMARPLEWLRERVLEKARSASHHADLEPPPGEEVAELANAFNDLLGALDERRRANEAFVADLVHEFKNPVAAIRACADSLETGGVDEKRATRLARILADSSARLDALVSEFLELARAEAGMSNETRASVDLTALARGVTRTFEATHPHLRFSVRAEAPCRVVGVEQRLDTLVRNLVDNAASFAGDAGEVCVRVDVEEDAPDGGDDRQKPKRIVLEVSDTGPGISEADRPHIFERFFTTRAIKRGEGEPSPRKRRGTGLGLALVKAIAEAHGGRVEVDAQARSGATLRVVLPAAPPS